MTQPRVAVTGAGGQLGSHLVSAFIDAGVRVTQVLRPFFDLEDPEPAFEGLDVDHIVNAAAWTDVEACASNPVRAMALNGTSVGHLANIARMKGARFVQISTNEVFDGLQKRAYDEDDEPRPINAYGRSKLAGELAARAAAPDTLIVRTAWIYGGLRSFPKKIVAAAERAASSGQSIQVVADEIGNPTPAQELADRIVTLVLRDTCPPIVHLAGEPPISRLGWAKLVLAAANLPEPIPIGLRDWPRASTPPQHAVLSTGRSKSLGIEPIQWMHQPS